MVVRQAKVLQKLFSEELGDRGDLDIGATTNATVPLERRFVRSVEDEERVDVEGNQAEEAVVEGAQRGIGATFAGLDLEEPDGDVDSKAKGTAVLFEVLDG